MAEVPARPRRSDFRFFWPVTVRWGDMDAFGHVNNATYCTYFESARIGFLERWGLRFPGDGSGAPVVVSQTIHYRAQVHYPSALEIGVRCAEVRHRSFVLEYAIFRPDGGDLVGDGNTVLAWVDGRVGHAVAVPDDLRERLTRNA
jgi:acyl-CoA thioester hydrolase